MHQRPPLPCRERDLPREDTSNASVCQRSFYHFCTSFYLMHQPSRMHQRPPVPRRERDLPILTAIRLPSGSQPVVGTWKRGLPSRAERGTCHARMRGSNLIHGRIKSIRLSFYYLRTSFYYLCTSTKSISEHAKSAPKHAYP